MGFTNVFDPKGIRKKDLQVFETKTNTCSHRGFWNSNGRTLGTLIRFLYTIEKEASERNNMLAFL